MQICKVRVKNLPVFYNGQRYEKGVELEIEYQYFDSSIFELVEILEDTTEDDQENEGHNNGDDVQEENSANEEAEQESPFKGVKASVIRKALEAAGVEVPEGISREDLIRLAIDNKIEL